MERLFPIMVAGVALWYIADRVSDGASLLPIWKTTIIEVDEASEYNNGVRFVPPVENKVPLYLTDDAKMMHQYDGYIQGMNTFWGPVAIEGSDGTLYV